MSQKKQTINILHQYHPDICVTAILQKNYVIGAIYDSEIFANGIVEMWN